MAARPVRLLERKGFLHWIEIFGIIGVAAASAVTASLTEPKHRTHAACVSGLFALIAGLSKIQYKKVEEREKEAKDKEQAEQKDKYKSQARRMARAVLSHMHGHFFEKDNHAERYKHRITLFVCIREDGPDDNKKRLVLYARFGTYNSNSTTTWPIDETKPGGCPGVSGKVWEENATKIVVADCDWPGDGGDAAVKEAYARSLFITTDQAQSLAVKSRYFGGAMVHARGEKWGVLLVDSLKDFRHPGTRDYTEEKQVERLEWYANMLGKLVAEDGA